MLANIICLYFFFFSWPHQISREKLQLDYPDSIRIKHSGKTVANVLSCKLTSSLTVRMEIPLCFLLSQTSLWSERVLLMEFNWMFRWLLIDSHKMNSNSFIDESAFSSSATGRSDLSFTQWNATSFTKWICIDIQDSQTICPTDFGHPQNLMRCSNFCSLQAKGSNRK